jgi:predicted MFS family arabinose efflux permease
VSGIIAAAIGWRGVFALSAGLMAAATLAIGLGLRESQPASSFKIGVALGRYRDILLNGRARTLFALVFVEAVAIFGIFPFIAPILAEQGKGGPTEAGLVLGGFAIGGLVYSLLVRWMLARLGLSRMLVSGGLVAGCALLALGSSTGWLHQALAMIGLGLGFYMLHNSFQTQVTEVAPTARASAVALHAFSFFCGQALGVVFIGYGLGTSGQAATLAVSALVIAALGAVAAWRLTGMVYPRAR